MDLQDFEILLNLMRRPFASNETLGKAIGLTANAAKARLARLERQRLLNGFYVMPSASVFQRHWQVIPFERLGSEPDLEKVLRVPGVVNVWRGRPRTLMVNVYARAREDPPPPELTEVLHRSPSGVVLPEPPDRFSVHEAILSPLDWRVTDVLLDRPRASLAELSKATGLTARTVRGHRDALLRKGLLTILPNIDTSREPGLLVYSGYVVAAQATHLEQLHAPGMVVLSRLHQPPSAWITGHVPSYTELQEVEVDLRSTPGITSVDLVPPRGGAMATTRLHQWIRHELRMWQSQSRRGELRQRHGRGDGPASGAGEAEVRKSRFTGAKGSSVTDSGSLDEKQSRTECGHLGRFFVSNSTYS